MPPIEHLLLGTALFLVASIIVSKLAVRSGVPVLLLFLAMGMLAGSDGPGGIYFDNPWLAQSVGVVALAFILFSGGLDTRWSSIAPVLPSGLLLSTVGVGMTALSVGLLMNLVFGFTLAEGILLGAIISSTDAAAVFGVLRGKDVRLKGQLKPLLELESGSNDPMAVFLTLGMIQLIQMPEASPLTLLPLFLLQMGIGGALGWGFGRLIVFLLNHLRLEYDGLYPVLTTAAVLLVYGATVSLDGNGFLAVYLAGLTLGRHDFIHRRSLMQFHDGLSWLMQIVMFLTLGLQVYPSRLPDVVNTGLLVAVFLILCARPMSVMVALARSGLRLREKLFIAWVGLRGAAPIVLATFPQLAGLGKAETIFNLVFFIVLTSVLLQGTLIVPVARLLGVYDTSPAKGKSPLAFVTQDAPLAQNLVEMRVPFDSPFIGQQILNLGLPPGVLIVLIGRGDDLVVPNGGTVIEVGDTLLLLANTEAQAMVKQRLMLR